MQPPKIIKVRCDVSGALSRLNWRHLFEFGSQVFFSKCGEEIDTLFIQDLWVVLLFAAGISFKSDNVFQTSESIVNNAMVAAAVL